MTESLRSATVRMGRALPIVKCRARWLPLPLTVWTGRCCWGSGRSGIFFTAMFVSLFGSGMNFIGVSWYIMSATHSTVAVSWQVIVVTLPGLVVPFLGGVLIDRYDRRYLGVLLDLARGFAVLAIAYIAWRRDLHLWHLYIMTLITGTGSAMYWANVNALVQEVIPPSQFTGANATVLVGVQTGMLLAGTFVGFIYDHVGHRRHSVYRRPHLFCLRLLPVFAAQGLRFAACAPPVSSRIFGVHAGNGASAGERRESGSGRGGFIAGDIHGHESGFGVLARSAGRAGAGNHARDADGQHCQFQRGGGGAGQRNSAFRRAWIRLHRSGLGDWRDHWRDYYQPVAAAFAPAALCDGGGGNGVGTRGCAVRGALCWARRFCRDASDFSGRWPGSWRNLR